MRIKQAFLKVIFILFAISNYSFSQNTGGIKVVVRDSLSRESIPFVVLQIQNTKLGTSTDVNGIALLKNIPVGIQYIQSTAVGYKKSIKKVNIEKDELQAMNIYLSPEPVVLQTVTKIGERSKESYGTNISIQTITQEEFKIIPLTVEKDILRTLKVLPGISTSGDVTGQFFVRGGAGDQNLILYDNMVIYNPFHALGLFSIFNGESIKASDVITGGFSPEFGGRLSSIINIVTKEGNRNYYGGKVNLGILSGQAYIEGPLPHGAFSISFRKSYFDEILKKFLSKEVPLSFYDFSGKTTIDISEQGKAFFNLLVSGDDITDSRPSEPNYEWNNYSFGATLQSFINQFLFCTSISYSSFKTEMDPKAQSDLAKLKSNVNDLFFNFKADYLFGNNDLFSAGCSILDQNMGLNYINSYKYYISTTKFLTELNFWARYKYNQIDNFVAEFGVRENISNTDKQSYYNLEPRLNLKYMVTPDIAIKGSLTRMHQMMMTTSNEDDLISLFEAWIPINGSFYPERADQAVFGFELSLFNHYNLTIQSYYKDIKNFLGYNLNRTKKEDPDFSSGRGKSYGLEALLKFNYNNYFGWITYNLNWADKTIDGLTFPPRYDKRHSLTVILGTKLPYDIDFSINWEGSSGMPFSPIIGYYDESIYQGIPFNLDYNEYIERRTRFGAKNSLRLPFYHKLDINITKSFIIEGLPKVNLALNIINVYDQKNIFYYDMKDGSRINMLPFLPSFSIGAEL